MEINLISERDTTIPLAEQILTNRGVPKNEIKQLLDTTDDHIQSYLALDNIGEAVDVFLKHMSPESNSKVVVQVDADVDGYTSAALIINYVNANFEHVQIDYQVHPQKAHGLIMSEDILSGKYNLVIVPDAGSNEYEKHAKLKELGVDCIVLDHHDAEKESKDAIIVNNQLSKDYANKELSGVGIVWQFCRAIDDHVGNKKAVADDFLDLVALGNVADMVDLKSLETYHLVRKGLDVINSGIWGNSFVNTLVKMQSYSLGPEVTPIGIAFYISPLINATVRVGTLEEREFVFKCFLDRYAHEIIPSNKQGAAEGETEKTITQGARLVTNIRNRQRRAQNDATEDLISHIDDEYLENNSVIVVDTGGKVVKDLNGLIANQVQSRFERPALVMSEENGLISGSGRGFESPVLTDFRGFIRDSGFAEFAEGHPQAFGAAFTEENFEEFIKYANENLNYEGTTHQVYDVDLDIDVSELTENLIEEILRLRFHWGEGIKEAYIVVRNVPVNKQTLSLMGKENSPTVKIMANGVTTIKFRPTKEELETLTPNDYTTLLVDMVARTNLNVWEGTRTPQLFISEFNVVDTRMNF